MKTLLKYKRHSENNLLTLIKRFLSSQRSFLFKAGCFDMSRLITVETSPSQTRRRVPPIRRYTIRTRRFSHLPHINFPLLCPPHPKRSRGLRLQAVLAGEDEIAELGIGLVKLSLQRFKDGAIICFLSMLGIMSCSLFKESTNSNASY